MNKSTFVIKAGKSFSVPFCILICLLTLADCATSPIDITNMESLKPDEGYVFGRIITKSHGDPVDLSKSDVTKTDIILLYNDTSEAETIILQKDGYFFWYLPEGNYTIADFDMLYLRGNGIVFYSGRYSIRIFSDFKVERNVPTYIGTLVVDLDYDIDIEDNFIQISQEFKKRFPKITSVPKKSLMVMEVRR